MPKSPEQEARDRARAEGPAIYFIGSRGQSQEVAKQGDAASIARNEVLRSDARMKEDIFRRFEATLTKDKLPIAPPINPHLLEFTGQQNSILPALIDVYCVNIDGTGAELEPAKRDEMERELSEALDREAESEAESEEGAAEEAAEEETETGDDEGEPNPIDPRAAFAKMAEEKAKRKDEEARRAEAIEEMEREIDRKKAESQSFFDEPWPGESFLSQRKKLRQHRGYTGNAYLEILRNVARDVVFSRVLDPKGMRLVQLDEPVLVPKKITRDGEEIEVDVWVRERRYVQAMGGKLVFFKDFCATRDLNRETGDWAAVGEELPADVRATEIMHFIDREDVETPYGVPIWLSSVPNVIGSRKAEEFNLEFFDNGGIPPVLILVSGGKVAQDAERALRAHFMSSGPNRHGAAIIEAFSTSGDMDSPNQVRVQVERFGSERQKDALFQNYIAQSDMRTRRSFRTPALFVGETEGMNFATAFASMMVTEAQVFDPEREEFDEDINLKLMPELPNPGEFIYRSKPLAVKDVAQQLVALALVKDDVDTKSLIKAVEEISGLELVMAEETPGMEPAMEAMLVAQGPPEEAEMEEGAGGPGPPVGGQGSVPAGSRPKRRTTTKAAPESISDRVALGLHEMARDMAGLLRADVCAPGQVEKIKGTMGDVSTLKPHEQQTFRALLAMEVFPQFQHDPVGCAELAEGAWGMLAKRALGLEDEDEPAAAD